MRSAPSRRTRLFGRRNCAPRSNTSQSSCARRSPSGRVQYETDACETDTNAPSENVSAAPSADERGLTPEGASTGGEIVMVFTGTSTTTGLATGETPTKTRGPPTGEQATALGTATATARAGSGGAGARTGTGTGSGRDTGTGTGGSGDDIGTGTGTGTGESAPLDLHRIHTHYHASTLSAPRRTPLRCDGFTGLRGLAGASTSVSDRGGANGLNSGILLLLDYVFLKSTPKHEKGLHTEPIPLATTGACALVVQIW